MTKVSKLYSWDYSIKSGTKTIFLSQGHIESMVVKKNLGDKRTVRIIMRSWYEHYITTDSLESVQNILKIRSFIE